MTQTSASFTVTQSYWPEQQRSTEPHMLLSIIIVNWNTRQHVMDCLASIIANPPAFPFEVLVFDNASVDGSVEAVAAEYPQVHLIASPENLGFARANNRAASDAQGQFLLLLNPDTVVSSDALDTLVQYLVSQPKVAAVGPRLVHLDGSTQQSIERLPTLYRELWRLLHLDIVYPVSTYSRVAFASRRPQRVDVLAGACLLLRREAIISTGLLDEEYFIYSEEIDLCDRLHEKGWELHWVPEVVVCHLGGQSTRQVADEMFIELYRSKVKFFRKRRGLLSAWLYKLVLLQAALVRIGLGKLVLILPVSHRTEWIEAGRQYGLLLGKLPGL
jgi:GT2 family glycosyltransferase